MKKNLPPHTNEAHPVTKRKEANKSLIIALITIAVIIVIVVLLFVADRFVGEAAYGLAPTDSAGIFLDNPVFTEADVDSDTNTFSIDVQANITKRTVAIGFVLDYGDLVSRNETRCADDVVSALPWGSELFRVTCDFDNNKIYFEHATVDPLDFKEGAFDIATIYFDAFDTGLGEHNLTFDNFTIIDFATNESMVGLTIHNETISVQEGECTSDDDCNVGEECNTTTGLCETVGLPDDSDGDGIFDDGDASGTVGDNYCREGNNVSCDDNCITVNNSWQWDYDNDTFGNACDNCKKIANPDQNDSNDDGIGDVCDGYDSDNDWRLDNGDGNESLYTPCNYTTRLGACDDNCINYSNSPQRDRDNDGLGNVCDNCHAEPNPDQEDSDNTCTLFTMPYITDPKCGDACQDETVCVGIGQTNCTDDGVNLTCYDETCLTPECVTAFEDLQEEGPECTSNTNCTEGYSCVEENATVNGTCILTTNVENYLGNCTGHPDYCSIKYDALGELCVENEGNCLVEDVDFCADGFECVGTNDDFSLDVSVCEEEVVDPEEEPEPKKPSRGGSGCNSQWSCTEWSFCNVSLEQERVCTDIKCNRPARLETQNCSACEESWVCSLWTTCQNGKQLRTCFDEHSCQTTILKPEEQRNCNQQAEGYTPSYISDQIPPPGEPATIQEPVSAFQQYKALILSLAIAVVVIIIIIFLLLHFHHGKKASNMPDLESWVKHEKSLGVDEKTMREALKQTDWHEDEIDDAFKKLS